VDPILSEFQAHQLILGTEKRSKNATWLSDKPEKNSNTFFSICCYGYPYVLNIFNQKNTWLKKVNRN
jgi:hypothetical protein